MAKVEKDFLERKNPTERKKFISAIENYSQIIK